MSSQELAADPEGPGGEADLRLAVVEDRLAAVREQVEEVVGVCWCADRGDGAGLGKLLGCCENSSASERVPDQELGGLVVATEVVRGVDQIGNVGGEVRVREVTAGASESCEVEPQHGDPGVRQCTGDTRSRDGFLATGEAVCEEGEGAGCAVGEVQTAGQPGARGPCEIETFTVHGVLPLHRDRPGR